MTLWQALFSRIAHTEFDQMKGRRARALAENRASSGRVYTATLDHIEHSNDAHEAVSALLDRLDRRKARR